MAWNTKTLQAMVNLPANKRPEITSADLAAAGPVATAHQFPWGAAFPGGGTGEPILRAPVRLAGR